MTRHTPTHAPAPAVTFWGAARTVTGSMHLLQVNGRQILLDCGLFQGRRSEARRRNSTFPFEPGTIDAVVLSHAHIDHCGNLPNLVRQGFRGPIYCTAATADLLAVMLADSAKIQEEDAAYLNRKRERGEPPIEALYRRQDVHRTARLVQPLPYEKPFDLGGGMEVRLVEAGHLLGSAMVGLRLDVGGREQRLTFTGDLGRRGLPILRDPAPVPQGALLISESTYGGRTHPPTDLLADSLAEVIRRTLDRGGKVLVPAFSLGRTQTIVYFLHQLINQGRLAELPVFVDSPLAVSATEVFRLHPECFDEETALLLEDQPNLFGGGRVRYVESVEESKQLNARREPCVIVSASGMCESGRILHHLKHNIEDPRTTVLIIGFQAPDTLGRRLVEKRPEVRIHNKTWKLRAEVAVLNGFSSHADHNELLAALEPLAGTAGQVCLVHGEEKPAEALAADLRGRGFAEVLIPNRGETVQL
ncbi:MAG: MBL fold metallo-hydrolase [Gemmataceae bacterium]|nr:MBL fold metallo-hydrolase [Gemmataceae bacterium]